MLVIPDSIRKEPSRYKQYRLLTELIERDGIQITDICLEEDRGIHILLAEIISGVERDESGRSAPSARRLRHMPIVELATVDGRPFAKIGDSNSHLPSGYKIGMEPLNTRQIRDLQRRGKSPDIMVEYPSRFQVTGAEAYGMLMRHGYRLVFPEFRERHSARPKTNWILYEIGGPYQAEVEAKHERRGPGRPRKDDQPSVQP